VSKKKVRRGMPLTRSAVMVSMRALTTAAVLGSLLTGCMAAPEAEELVFLDEEREAMLELRAIPYEEVAETVAPSVEQATEPEPSSHRASARPRFVADAPGPDACWGVEGEGFPAISDDGTTIVAPRANHLQLSYTPGTMELEWHDVERGRITRSQPVVVADERFDETDERACARVARGIRRRAHAANMALAAAGRWRAMERLPVALFHSWAAEESGGDYLADTLPGDRVAQLVVRHGEVVLRIPGVKVLERHPLPAGEPFAVYGDRATGTVLLVTSACVGDSCTCDPSFTSHVLHWSPESFAAIEHDPCVAFDEDATEDERVHESWTSCEPLDLGFDVAPWSFA
jgi:hypothetical protein